MSGPELPGFVTAPALAPLWSRVARRLEETGLVARGRTVVTGLDRPARHAAGDLLGRVVLADRVTVDLAELDGGLAPWGGLVAVAERVLVRRLRDRPAERDVAASRRTAPIEALLGAADAYGLTGDWVGGWVDGLRAAGLLSRLSVDDGVEVAQRAVAILAALGATALEATDGAPVARTELAARHAGNAHALDDGSLLGAVVLRGLAARLGAPMPTRAAERRELWERAGAQSDLVSTTCLVLGLRPAGPGTVSARLRAAAEGGDPVHVTPRELRRESWSLVAGLPVLVCENPRVLEAVADARGGEVAVVCTSGSPAAVCMEVLERLAASGARLRYHGDFDWPGVGIANRMLALVGAQPWLMGAADYLRGGTRETGLPLVGSPVEARWDAELAPAMRATGTAVHEEAVLDEILAALD